MLLSPTFLKTGSLHSYLERRKMMSRPRVGVVVGAEEEKREEEEITAQSFPDTSISFLNSAANKYFIYLNDMNSIVFH